MVFIVNAENRHCFERDLLEMHQQRRRVFVEGLGWPLPLSGAMELDQYDGNDVIYLLVKDDPDARLRASVRLLALHCGWEAKQLGPTQPDRHDEVTAIVADVTRAGLRRVRGRFGIPGPVIRFFPAAATAPTRVAA